MMADRRVRLKQGVYYSQKLVYKLVDKYRMPTANGDARLLTAQSARDCLGSVLKLHVVQYLYWSFGREFLPGRFYCFLPCCVIDLAYIIFRRN
jgi:hypothetical protein